MTVKELIDEFNSRPSGNNMLDAAGYDAAVKSMTFEVGVEPV